MTFSEDLEQELQSYPPTAWAIRNRYALMVFIPVLLMFLISMAVVVAGGNSNGVGALQGI